MFVSFTPAIAGLLPGQLPAGNLVRLPGVTGVGRRAGFNPRVFGPRAQGIPANPRAQVVAPPIDPITGGIDLVTQGNALVLQGVATGDLGMIARGAEMRDRGENLNKAQVSARKLNKKVIEEQLS